MDTVNFVDSIIREFPQYKSEIVEDNGLPYLQIGVLTRGTNAAIREQKDHLVSEIFNFLAAALSTADDEVKNIIAVGYLEHLEFDEHRRYLDGMPPVLRKVYDDITAYNQETKIWFDDFLKNNPDFKGLWEDL